MYTPLRCPPPGAVLDDHPGRGGKPVRGGFRCSEGRVDPSQPGRGLRDQVEEIRREAGRGLPAAHVRGLVDHRGDPFADDPFEGPEQPASGPVRHGLDEGRPIGVVELMTEEFGIPVVGAGHHRETIHHDRVGPPEALLLEEDHIHGGRRDRLWTLVRQVSQSARVPFVHESARIEGSEVRVELAAPNAHFLEVVTNALV
jgi:hypothetical protein